jgi:hypothetical protein
VAETIGLLIFASAEAAGATGAAALGSTAIIGTLTVNAVVGAAVLTAASIGLQYALSNPNVPKAENGAQPLKQSVPIRQRGYWINRLSGYYMLFLAAGGDSQDVLAFHSGRIEEALQLYMHDQTMSLDIPLTDGAIATVVGPGVLAQNSQAQVFYGSDAQNSSGGAITSGNTSGVWTTDFAGKGIACLCLFCPQATNPTDYTQKYPQGLPLPSVVAKCAPIWDPRDVTQTESNRASWRASPNPVLQLMDYLTEPDGGMGEDRTIILPPAALAQWMAEADLCDADVGGRARYESAGFYQFDNSPDSVIGKLLSTCDGWLGESGDGSLVLTIGHYRDPTDPPLTADCILGFSVKKGQADEESINQLDVTYTNTNAAYVTDQIDSVRDEAAISASGVVRAKPLDLSWVQNADQAASLAQRAMLRVNPAISGTFITTLYGMRYLGKRWVKVQFPTVRGLEDCVVEIQDKGGVDLLGGKVTLNWQLVDPVALTALN